MQRSSTEQDGKVSEMVAVADCKVRCAGFWSLFHNPLWTTVPETEVVLAVYYYFM